jgi:DNA-directed RNA polymerase subunit RPC12/RpoP
MAYRKPSDTEIVEAIRDALRRHGVINSQRKMTELVLKELHRHDSDYSVSENRVRRLAINNELAKVVIRSRDSKEKTRAGACPVCGARTKPIRNETVYGGTVTRGYKCGACGYWTGLKHRVPTLYVFSPKQ